MAIIQGLPGLEVTIFTGGRTAKEYADPSETGGTHKRPRVVTKYIECKDNEPFRIHLKATDEYSWGFKGHILNFAAVIDGIWAKSELCRQGDTKQEEWERDISYRVVKSPDDSARYVIQEFAFSSIIKTDDATDEQHESDMEKIERLGTIEVKVHRATVREDGPISVPGGDHPKGFAISREAVQGKAKSHGIKYTRTQPAVKPKYIRCSTLADDDGPIAIFRFKYRSREALKLAGITPDPQQPFDWLVGVSDGEQDGDKGHNSGGNLQNPSNTSKQVQTKIKKEKEDDGGNIASSPASPTADQNSSTRPAEPPQPKHSILPDIQLSRPGTRNRTGTHNSSLLKRSGLKIHKRRRRIVRTDPVPVRNNPEKEISADGQARLGHVSYHSSLRPVANIIPRLKSLINNEPQVKQGVSGSAHGTTSTDKRALGKPGPQDKSRNDDNEVAVAGETKTPLSLRSCDITLPSIEQHVGGTEIKAKTRAKTRSKTGKTITHDTGKTIGLGDKNKSTTHGTVVSSRGRRFKRGAMHDHNVSSFKDIDWAEQERRDEADIKMMLNFNVDPRTSEANLTQLSSFSDKVIDQTGKAEDAIDFEDMSDGDLASDPGSIDALPGKDERQSLIKHSKNHIDNQCRGVQLVRELRQGVDQVSDDVFKKAEPNRRSSGIAAPIPSSAPPQTRTMTATNLLKSMLLPPPPSSNHAKTTVLSEGLLPPLLHTPADQTGRASIRRNEPVPSSTSKITNSRTANTNVSTGAVTHMTHTDKEKKAATKVATKRKSSKLSDALTGHPPHTHLPRPSKKPKTRDEREIINLVDSD